MSNRIYEKYLPQTLQESHVAYVEDPELMSLKNEMGLLRTLLGKYVEGIDLAEGIDENHLKAVSGEIDKISKTQQSISAHENRMREVIPVKMLPMILRSIGLIIKTVVDDPKAVRLIQQKIREIPNVPIKMLDVEVGDGKE